MFQVNHPFKIIIFTSNGVQLVNMSLLIILKLVITIELNLFIYEARESSLVPAGFLAAKILQKLWIMKPFLFAIGNFSDPW